MWYPWRVHVIPMWYVCMWYPCGVHAMPMWCACDVHEMSIPLIVLMFFICFQMESELERFHKQNTQLELNITELRQKLKATEKEMKLERQKVRSCWQNLKTYTVLQKIPLSFWKERLTHTNAHVLNFIVDKTNYCSFCRNVQMCSLVFLIVEINK